MRATLLILAALLGAVPPASSQPMSFLPAGARVRLQLRADAPYGLPKRGWLIGSVIEVGPDSLKIRFPQLDSASMLAWATIKRLDVSYVISRTESARQGANAGALIGAVIGVVAGTAKGEDGVWIWNVLDETAEGAVYGTIAGATLGATASEDRRERWERVWPVPASRSRRPIIVADYPLFRATPKFSRQ